MAVAAAMAVALLAFTATAGATSFAVSLTGPQAGSDQDQTWAIAPTAGATIDSMQIGLSRGYWPHLDRVTAACTNAQAQSNAGCPAASRIAGVQAVAMVGGVLPVVRSGYLANATQGKVVLKGQDVLLIYDQNGPQERLVTHANTSVHALDGNPETVIDFPAVPTVFPRTNGARVSAPLLAMAIRGGDSTNGGKRWLRNPTSCGAAAGGGGRIRLSVHYTDGRTDAITRSPSIGGCDLLGMRVDAMFNPKEYTLNRASKFDAAVDLPSPPAGGLTSDPKSVSIQVPGSIDPAGIATLETCSAAELSKANCPAGSRIGTMTAFSGPPREAARGELYFMSFKPRAVTGDAARIELGAVLRGGDGTGGAIWIGTASIAERDFLNAGGVVIALDGIGEMDVRRLELSVDNPLYKDTGKCGTNPLYVGVGGWSGAQADTTTTFTAACAPVISLTGPADKDSDGDGVADQPFRPASFEVPFSVADGGTGVDWSSAECSFKGWNGTIKGSTKLADLNGDGRPDVCAVSGARDGDGTLELRIGDGKKSIFGIVRRTFTVDASRPTLSDLSPSGGEWLSCENNPATGRRIVTIKLKADDGAGTVKKLEVSFNNGPRQTVSIDPTTPFQSAELSVDCRELTTGLDVEYRVFATDEAGNEGEDAATLRFDKEPPVIEIPDLAYIQPSSFDIPIRLTDEGSGIDPSKFTATGTFSDGTSRLLKAADLDGDGLADVVSVDGAPDGPITVTLSTQDNVGHAVAIGHDFIVETPTP